MKEKYVTTVRLRQPVPQFDFSFCEKLLKIVAILGYISALNSPNGVWRPGSAVQNPLKNYRRTLTFEQFFFSFYKR